MPFQLLAALRAAAAVIRDETDTNENTATRVGGAMLDMVDSIALIRVHEFKLGTFAEPEGTAGPNVGWVFIMPDVTTDEVLIFHLTINTEMGAGIVPAFQIWDETHSVLLGDGMEATIEADGATDNASCSMTLVRPAGTAGDKEFHVRYRNAASCQNMFGRCVVLAVNNDAFTTEDVAANEGT